MRGLGVLLLLFLVARAGSSSSSAPSSGRRPARARAWTDDEMRAFVRELEPVGVGLEHVLLVWASESGLDPHASSGSAWGLMQAQAPLLRAVGWTDAPQAFGALDVVGQLPWLAKMLRLQVRGIGYKPASALELYRANLSPLAAKERRDVIYRRDDPAEGPLYNGNRGLDVEGKGFIHVNDLARVLDRVERSALYQRAVAHLRRIRA